MNEFLVCSPQTSPKRSRQTLQRRNCTAKAYHLLNGKFSTGIGFISKQKLAWN